MHLCEKANKNYRFKQPVVSSYFLHRLNADEQFVSSRKMITFIIFIHRCMCSVTCTSMARHLTVEVSTVQPHLCFAYLALSHRNRFSCLCCSVIVIIRFLIS